MMNISETACVLAAYTVVYNYSAIPCPDPGPDPPPSRSLRSLADYFRRHTNIGPFQRRSLANYDDESIWNGMLTLWETEADPGSVKRGGGGAGNPNSSMPRSKITKIGQKNKNRPKKRGGRGRFGPPPPRIRHWKLRCVCSGGFAQRSTTRGNCVWNVLYIHDYAPLLGKHGPIIHQFARQYLNLLLYSDNTLDLICSVENSAFFS